MKNIEQQLRAENEELKNEVRELKETLEAISSGEVDAIVVSKADEKKIYTLENEDQPYRVLIENIQEGALTLSPDGMILYGNSAFASMRGVPLPEIIGTNLQQHIAPRDKARIDRVFGEVMKRPVRCDVTICSGHGSIPVLLSMTALNLGRGTKISAVVTDRRKDYDQLLLQSRMLDGVADAVIAIGPDEKILYWNDTATRIYGWQRDEVIGRNLTSVAAPDNQAQTILENLKKGETWSGEYMVKHKDGHLFPVFARDSPIFDDEGRLIAVIGASNDITERKRAEESLQQKHRELNIAYEKLTSTQEQLRQNIEELSKREHELNEALREKEILISEVHHRVKNNLTAFISLLSLESAYDESPAGLALKKDLQNRARSMALIHETLYRTKKYSRVDMDVYLSTLARQVVSSYESAKSIQIVVDANGITLDLSRATPCGLIINELLTNSLKYAFPASFDCETIRCAPCTVEVNLMEDAGSHILTVRDNGIGLPDDLNLATTKTLGLKLVNFLARHQLRASIEIRSDKGAELRFRFRDKM